MGYFRTFFRVAIKLESARVHPRVSRVFGVLILFSWAGGEGRGGEPE